MPANKSRKDRSLTGCCDSYTHIYNHITYYIHISYIHVYVCIIYIYLPASDTQDDDGNK